MNLQENERIDDLEINGLKIIQNKKWFCFGIDSVLLSDFAKEIRNKSTILDLGSGNGILELLLSYKVPGSKITGVEVQKKVCEMAKRSVKLNGLEDRIEIINMNIKNYKTIKKYDAVVLNPPYKENGTGLQNEIDEKIIARHEVLASLEDFIKIGGQSLKDKGKMYIVNKPQRLADIFEYSRKYKLEPKELRMVYSKANSQPTLILIKLVKNANKDLKVRKPLYIYEENGNYTKEILKIYGKEK